jgi:hypothetical protein
MPHTPGPWLWRNKSGSLHRAGEPPYTYGDTVLEPSYEYESGVDTTISEDDAALIAAAPDMLAALKSLDAIVSEIHEKWDAGMKSGKLLIALMDPTLSYRADITAIHAAIAKAEGR